MKENIDDEDNNNEALTLPRTCKIAQTLMDASSKRAPLIWPNTSTYGDDFNLTALINSVERDIRMLEQMESATHDDDDNKDDNLQPLNSSFEMDRTKKELELLDLPGYRPAPRNGGKSSSQNDNTIISISSPPPPIPPKQRRIQRRHSTSSPRHETQSTLSRDDSFRTLWIRKGNVVSNALYSRRLPSPPISRKLRDPDSDDPHLVRSQDDSSFLLNSSRILATHLTRQFGHSAAKKLLFCPLCTQTFAYNFGLECHLLSVHFDELDQYREYGGLSKIKTQNCPCCRAQFLKSGLVVRHLLCQHPDYVLNTVLTERRSESSDTFKCRFCSQHFLKRHQKLLMLHIEQKHVKELEELFRSGLYSSGEQRCQSQKPRVRSLSDREDAIVVQTPDSSLEADHQFVKASEPFTRSRSLNYGKRTLRFSSPEVEEHHYYEIIDDEEKDEEADDLSGLKRNRSMRVTSNSGAGQKDIDKPFFRRPSYYKHKKTCNKEITCTPFSKAKARSSTKRTTYQGMPQPEPPLYPDCFEKRNSVATSESSCSEESGIGSQATDYTSNLNAINHYDMPEGERDSFCSQTSCSDIQVKEPMRLFKCNLCDTAFLENAFLLTHIKNKHRSKIKVALIKPKYSCGACPAKFFKNTFLLKHSECHQFQFMPQSKNR